MILTTCLVQSCPLPLILEGTSWHLLPPSPIALWALGSSCMPSSTTLSLSAASCKGQTKKKEIWAKHTIQSNPFKELFSLFTRNTSFLIGGGFTDSDESDSYAGDLPDGPGDLFTRVRRFQGSTGPPSGGPVFPGSGPPRGRPGFMFPPPPAGPPPEPGDLYSVLQCKDFNIETKKTQIWNSVNIWPLDNIWRLSVEILYLMDAFQGNPYKLSTSKDSVKNCMSIIYPDLCFLML